MEVSITGRSKELLLEPNFCHVSTIKADGTPHAVLVWVDTDGQQVILNSAAGRAWVNNVERDPNVYLIVANQENPYEYVSIPGQVVEITDVGADEHINQLTQKYMGKPEYPFRAPGEVRLIIKVKPKKVKHSG